MVETVTRSLRDSPSARWAAMAVVAFTMFCGYFVADVAAPLKPLIEKHLQWTSSEYGLYTSAYAWFNVFLLMLIFVGIILDKMGPRFAGLLALGLMLGGTLVNAWAFTPAMQVDTTLLGVKLPVLVASLGFAFFGVGIELCGITATKVIVRWFKGYEMALAMGLQLAVARMGATLAFSTSAPLASVTSVATPVFVGAFILGIGVVAFLVYCGMDRRLAASEPEKKAEGSSEDAFRLSDIKLIVRNRGFWLITLLCAIFYSAVFPFLKYAADLMVHKYGVSEKLAGLIPAMVPIGTAVLTPVFGRLYDKKGKGATIMLLGAFLVLCAHVLLTIPALVHFLVPIAAMIVLGVGFSLVPSAMWPSVPRLIPEKQLGTAYAMIFWVQNIALMVVPYLIGRVLDAYCVISREPKITYDYTWPMAIFALIGLMAIAVALMLKADDRRSGYGLEQPLQKLKRAEPAASPPASGPEAQ